MTDNWHFVNNTEEWVAPPRVGPSGSWATVMTRDEVQLENTAPVQALSTPACSTKYGRLIDSGSNIGGCDHF
jgi:hypothetical protein